MVKKRKKNSWFKESNKDKKKECFKCGCGGFYFLGFMGAAVYYIQQSTSFWQGVLGILKAIVWPAFLVHKLLG